MTASSLAEVVNLLEEELFVGRGPELQVFRTWLHGETKFPDVLNVSGPSGVRLPPQYSLFGKVIKGLETLTAIEATGSSSGAPSEKVTIESVTITESD